MIKIVYKNFRNELRTKYMSNQEKLHSKQGTFMPFCSPLSQTFSSVAQRVWEETANSHVFSQAKVMSGTCLQCSGLSGDYPKRWFLSCQTHTTNGIVWISALRPHISGLVPQYVRAAGGLQSCCHPGIRGYRQMNITENTVQKRTRVKL